MYLNHATTTTLSQISFCKKCSSIDRPLLKTFSDFSKKSILAIFIRKCAQKVKEMLLLLVFASHYEHNIVTN